MSLDQRAATPRRSWPPPSTIALVAIWALFALSVVLFARAAR